MPATPARLGAPRVSLILGRGRVWQLLLLLLLVVVGAVRVGLGRQVEVVAVLRVLRGADVDGRLGPLPGVLLLPAHTATLVSNQEKRD